jgi:hypothetical protein
MKMSDKEMQVLSDLINCLTYYVPFVTMTIGTISSICNIIIFTSRELRYNSCGFYLLCSTIFDLIYLLFSGITRFMIDSSFNESIFFCKFLNACIN